MIAQGAEKDWEPAKRQYSDAKTVSHNSEIEIRTMPSVILVNLNQPAKIEIFTILGRLVSEKTLQPGSYEFELPAHGIYIVKIGDMTCKVAV